MYFFFVSSFTMVTKANNFKRKPVYMVRERSSIELTNPPLEKSNIQLPWTNKILYIGKCNIRTEES